VPARVCLKKGKLNIVRFTRFYRYPWEASCGKHPTHLRTRLISTALRANASTRRASPLMLDTFLEAMVRALDSNTSFATSEPSEDSNRLLRIVSNWEGVYALNTTRAKPSREATFGSLLTGFSLKKGWMDGWVASKEEVGRDVARWGGQGSGWHEYTNNLSGISMVFATPITQSGEPGRVDHSKMLYSTDCRGVTQ